MWFGVVEGWACEQNMKKKKVFCVCVCVFNEGGLRGRFSIHHRERLRRMVISLYVCEHIYIYSYSASFKEFI